ncbi:MAG: glycosyltransferase family 39 protein [Prevotella sp.]|nr:glycosyltransferase family 39 protein [Prevotella sp.]
MRQYTHKQTFWILLLLCLLTLFPFIGAMEYNTKGEPREAIVSQSMLATGNWVLPRNSGGEMAYKPPFFHWCVAVCSLPMGEVTEGSSRLPSAIALTALVMTTFVFFSRRKNLHIGVIAALICLLAMETHRAGGNCRVDMVLTALTVGAIYLMYGWYEKHGMRGVPWLAVLLMSAGTLTKGPVGTIIPCIVMGGFLLLKRQNFFRIFWRLLIPALLSLLLPLVWYYAAYQQGGQEFIDLVYEENIGRMTNTMTYESCVEPWWYNFLTLTYGLLPFNILLLLGLASLKGRQKFSFNKLSDITLFSLSSAVIIIVFYCIPQSKRSVYLMPMYPFLAYFVALFMCWLAKNRKRSLDVYTGVIATLGLLLFAVFIAVKADVVPITIFHGRHAQENIDMMHAIADISSPWAWTLILLPTILCAYYWWWRRKNEVSVGTIYYSFAMILLLNLAVDGAYKAPVMNVKSIKTVASDIASRYPDQHEKMYEYIEAGVQAAGDPVHFFELNFYLNDRIDNFHKAKPSEGLLLIGDEDMSLRRKDFEKEGYLFSTPLYTSSKRVLKQTLHIYRFHR